MTESIAWLDMAMGGLALGILVAGLWMLLSGVGDLNR